MDFKSSYWDITKSVCIVVLVGFLIFFGFKGFSTYEEHLNKGGDAKQPSSLSETEIEKIAEGAASRIIVENNRELRELINKLAETDSKILKIIEKRDEDIKEVGTVVAKVKQRVDKMSEASDHVYSKGSVHDHEFTKVYAKDEEGKEYPVAWAMYHPNQTEDKKWKTGTYPLELNLNLVEAEQKDGKDKMYVEAWIENNQNKETKGNQYPVEISDFKWIREEIKDKEFSFNPRLGFTGNFGSEDIFPGIDISFFSYGRTHRDVDWRFVGLGIGGTNDNFYGYFLPVQYNLGNVLPLIENLNVGPSIGINDDQKYNYGVGASVLF